MELMNRKRAALGGTLVSGLALVLALGVSTPAIAADTLTIGEVAAALDGAGTLVEPGIETTRAGDGFVANSEKGAVTLPDDAEGQVIVEGDDGPVGIGVPGASDADGVAAVGGVVYEGALADTSVVAKATEEGVQLLVVLGSSEAPTSMSFPVQAAPNSALELNPDGSVALFESIATGHKGQPAKVLRGGFAAPWAVDANGAVVPTSYEVRGMELIQHVYPTESTAFPVTADPAFKVTWKGLYVHWYRGNVKWMNGLSWVMLGGAIGTLCTGPHAMLCATVVGGVFYTLYGWSDRGIDWMFDRGYRLTSRLLPTPLTYWEKR